MPYIDKLTRDTIDELVVVAKGNLDSFLDLLEDALEHGLMDSDICYIIYKIIARLYGRPELSWSQRMNAIKILESAKDEFMQNYVRPYEKMKKQQHGDVR